MFPLDYQPISMVPNGNKGINAIHSLNRILVVCALVNLRSFESIKSLTASVTTSFLGRKILLHLVQMNASKPLKKL